MCGTTCVSNDSPEAESKLPVTKQVNLFYQVGMSISSFSTW